MRFYSALGLLTAAILSVELQPCVGAIGVAVTNPAETAQRGGTGFCPGASKGPGRFAFARAG